MRTQVAVVGARPSGTVPSHLFERVGVDAIVPKHRGRADVERRLRAGVSSRGPRSTRPTAPAAPTGRAARAWFTPVPNSAHSAAEME